MAQALHDEGTLLELVHKRWAEQFDEVRQEGIELGMEIGMELGMELGKEIGMELGRELGKEIGMELGIERVRWLASQRKLVCQHAASRFGEDETAWLASSLADIDDPDLIDSVGSWIGECGSAAELGERIRTASVQHG